MRHFASHTAALLSLLLLPFWAYSQWVGFTDASSDWLSVGADDQEKDIAVADFNNDGWQDVVVVRKNPFSNPGGQADLLLINTGSTLEDMTAIYAPEFLSNPSDSRDVFAGDLDNDGWTDLVLANTFEDQPIFYHNLGDDGNGDWQGFADVSDDRFPLPLGIFPLQFCAVWGGDVTGDGFLDLYFSNYNPGGLCEDVLLINDGTGHFTDESAARLGNLRNSAFGTSVEIHDMDADGDQDIVKISTLFGVPPWNDNGVYILFNEGDGNFSNWMMVPSSAPYMFTVGDFNRDGLNDLYVVDDSQDYLNIATTVTPDQSITYSTIGASDPRSTGFGGNCKLADIDNDGDLDLGLADVDVDIPPCESGASLRKFTMSRNDGGTLSAPYGNTYHPWNESTFDFGWIDLNNDCYPDLFLGRCNGYEVFLNDGNTEYDWLDLGGETTLCPGEELTVDAGHGFSAYEWSDGSNEQIRTFTEGGEYCVTLTNGLGCTDVECLTILQGTLQLSVDFPPSFCEGETATMEATPGFAAYLWSTGETTASIEIAEGGTYCVTVVDEFGCEFESCQTVILYPVSQTTLEADLCFGGSVVVGGAAYSETGVYEIALTDLNGCDSLITLDLSVSPEIIVVDVVIVDDNGSNTGSIIPNIGGQDPFHFLWSTGDTLPTISGLAAGDYELEITDANGCMASFTFTVDFSTAVKTLADYPVSILAAPNPFRGSTNIDLLGAGSGPKTLQLYDARGQIVYRTIMEGNSLALEESLPAGWYLLTISRRGKVVGVGRIMKQ